MAKQEHVNPYETQFLNSLDLRNDVTRSMDIAGAEILHHDSPGITIVKYPTEGRDIVGMWFNDESEKGLITYAGLEQMEWAIRTFSEDSRLGGLVLTDNNSGRVSQYGMDVVREFGPIFERASYGEYADMETLLQIGQRIVTLIHGSRKPIIAGVRGLIVGGGFEFAIPSHFIMQGEGAKYALPECQLDVIEFARSKGVELDIAKTELKNGKVLFPGWLGMVHLLRKYYERGMVWENAVQIVEEFTFNGMTIDSEMAYKTGLADITVDDGRMMEFAAELINSGEILTVRDDYLHLPIWRPKNPAPIDTPGKEAGRKLLYDHYGNAVRYGDLTVRANKLMINAMHIGLSVDGQLPYPEVE